MTTSPLTRWDMLKIAGIFLMFIDHSGHFYFEDMQWLRGIGRASAPLFLFLAGFAPHYKFDRKLIVLALFLTLVDWGMKGAPNTLNILCSILVIRAILRWLEKRGRFALKLHEWFIGAVAMMPLIVVFQYGSLGFLFALAAYVYKHRKHYSPQTPRRFLWLVIVFYGVSYALLSEFTLLTTSVMIVSLIAMGMLMEWFTQNPRAPLSMPATVRAMLKPFARYTAEIYVLHLVVLVALTGKAL